MRDDRPQATWIAGDSPLRGADSFARALPGGGPTGAATARTRAPRPQTGPRRNVPDFAPHELSARYTIEFRVHIASVNRIIASLHVQPLSI